MAQATEAQLGITALDQTRQAFASVQLSKRRSEDRLPTLSRHSDFSKPVA